MRYLSICSGIEAASVAWRPLGWEPAAFAEIEPFPCAVLKHHFPNVQNFGDITAVAWSKYRGAIDLVVGGTPCQSFSIAGRREGMDGASGLVREYFRLLQEVRPKWFVWENVPGCLSSGGGQDFSAILRGWHECGYHVSWRVLDAQFFGVPQRRRRVFAVGHSSDWRLPVKVLFEPASVLGDTGKSGKKGEGNPGISENRIAGTVSSKWAKGTGGPAGDECYNLVCATVAPTIGASAPPYSRPGNERVETEALCWQDKRVRRLTPLECERLQGLPDGWTDIEYRGKPAPDGSRYKAIGNSMAVPCMRWLGERIDEVSNGREQ